MIVLWDPDDVFVSRWHKCLVLPLAYECWAGKCNPDSCAALLVSQSVSQTNICDQSGYV